MKIYISDLKKMCCFALPTIIILAQWISIAGIKGSWILSICLLIYLIHKHSWAFRYDNKTILITLVMVLVPIINFKLGISNGFNSSLYISLVTGMILYENITLMSEESMDYFWRGLLLSCIIFALWGMFEILTGNYIIATNTAFTMRNNVFGLHYPIVAFPNTNDLAQYLCGLFPLCFYKYIKKEPIKMCIASLLVLYVIYNADARMAMILLFAGIVAPIFIKLVFAKNYNSILKIFIVIVVSILLVFIIDMKTGIFSTIYEKFLRVSTKADYFLIRNGLYIELLNFAKNNPMGGFGSSYLVSTFPPHNLFLFVLVDYGWFVCLAFFAWLIKCLMQLSRLVKNDIDNLLNEAIMASLMLFPLFSMISSCNEQRKVVWIVLAIIVRYSQKKLMLNKKGL